MPQARTPIDMRGGPAAPAARDAPAAPEADRLSTGDWAVLGVLGEAPTHGFAAASALGPGGSLADVWTLPQPVVYQSIARLRRAGLLAPVATERSRRGPARTILTVTPEGREALDSWLASPVEHVRDVRSSLLLKLALRHRAGLPLAPLARAQRDLLRPALGGLQAAAGDAPADSFDAVVARWRLVSYRATCAFLDDLLAATGASPVAAVDADR